MKSIENKPTKKLKSDILTVVILFVMLFGLSIKLNAQSPVIGTDMDKLKNSMKLHVNGSDLSVLIPKVSTDEITAYTSLSFDQMVYVTDQKVGFYQFSSGEWVKVSVAQAIKNVKSNLELATPKYDNIILNGSIASAKNMLDYNGHIKDLNEVFGSNNTNSKNFAVNYND